ncbi:unnamed protein product [Rotaria sp. Silwood2]|nr:unnamed protein product [Rotaria sp. Silwood2]
MYHGLCNERYENYVTTDETRFYLDTSQLARDIYCVRNNELSEKECAVVTSTYYTAQMMQPLINHDIPRLFPDDETKEIVLHQDNALRHTARDTLAYMKENNPSHNIGRGGA